MAYIPPTEEEEQGQQGGMNVLGQPPMGQQTQEQEQEQQQVPTQPATGGTIQAGANQPRQPRGQGRQQVGSGLFTNIKKYVQANRGAGQQIGQTVQQRGQEQAAQIGQQIQQQRQQQAQRVQEGQSKIQGAQQFGQQMIQQAGTQQFQDPDVERFQQLRTGQRRFDESVSPLTFSQQARDVGRMQRQAEEAGTEAGRDILLDRTFGEGQQYTAGQRRLDSLLLGTDPTAQQQTVQTLRDVAAQQAQALQEARRGSREDIYGLREAQRGLQEGLQTGLEEAFTGVRSDIEARAAQYDEGMEGLAQNIAEGMRTGQLYEEDIQSLTGPGSEYLRGLVGKYTGFGTGADLDNILGQLSARGRLGEQVGDQIVYTDPELQRIATEQEVARQRALERLQGISDAERTFLVGPEDLTGQLQVGRYTGEDIGLIGDAGQQTFQSAYEQRMSDIQDAIEQKAKEADDHYYWDRGRATGYGWAPRRGTRDAKALAREAIEHDVDISGTDSRLLELYGGPAEIEDLNIDSLQQKQQQLEQQRQELAILQLRRDLETSGGKTWWGQMDYQPLSEQDIQRLAELEQINFNERAQILQRSMNEAQQAQSYLDAVEARRQAVAGMRQGRFGLARRSSPEQTAQIPTNKVMLTPEEEDEIKGIIS